MSLIEGYIRVPLEFMGNLVCVTRLTAEDGGGSDDRV